MTAEACRLIRHRYAPMYPVHTALACFSPLSIIMNKFWPTAGLRIYIFDKRWLAAHLHAYLLFAQQHGHVAAPLFLPSHKDSWMTIFA